MFNNKLKAINPVEYAKGIVANEQIRFDDFNGEKKYFSKYLPVDGDIQVGDSILDPNNNVYKCTRIDNIYLNCSGYNGLVRISRCKKVKLFLCSRDIQVGDEVMDNSFTSFIWKGTFGDIIGNFYAANKDNTFKVLGEISTEATWIKEGEKFYKDEINWLYQPEYSDVEYHSLDDYPTWKQLIKNRRGTLSAIRYFPPIVAIKGPCGHFH